MILGWLFKALLKQLKAMLLSTILYLYLYTIFTSYILFERQTDGYVVYYNSVLDFFMPLSNTSNTERAMGTV